MTKRSVLSERPSYIGYRIFDGCLKDIMIILPPIYNKIIAFTMCEMRV